MAGSDRVPDPNDSKRARGWKAQTTTRAKWRSSLSAYRSVLQNVLDTADIVREGDVTSSTEDHAQRIGQELGEFGWLAKPSHYTLSAAKWVLSVMAILRQLTTAGPIQFRSREQMLVKIQPPT